MGNTPTPTGGQNIETITYKTTPPPAGTVYTPTPKASYTPAGNINPLSYGKSTSAKPQVLGSVPTVQVGGGTEPAPLPSAFTGHFTVGDNKNVSTPVTGT